MNDEEVYFQNREEAGNRLAELLEKYRNQEGVVYALPRGGVPVAKEIARRLNWPLDLVIIRKIGHPQNPEYAVGAVSEDGLLVVNEAERAALNQDWFQQEKERQLQEAKRRRELYLKGKPSATARGKIALLVDDGIATGSTMRVAIKAVKRQQPAKVIVAVPISPRDTAARIREEVDEFVAVGVPQYFLGAIGAYYADFTQVSDEEVIALLEDQRR
jgi:putative phosphoribosyl transferase